MTKARSPVANWLSVPTYFELTLQHADHRLCLQIDLGGLQRSHRVRRDEYGADLVGDCSSTAHNAV